MKKHKKGYKDTEIGMIPEDWDFALIEDVISDITMGPFGSDITVSNFVSSGIPVLNGNNVSSECLKDVFANFVTKEKALQLKKAIAKRGDVIITHRGTLGQIAYIPHNSQYELYVISQSQFRVTFKPTSVDPRFIVSFFHSPKGQSILLQGKGHTGVPALAQPTTTFRKLRVPIPSLKEQQAIAEALSDIDALINTLNKQIKKKKNIKQGAMQELLTGKNRLQGFSGQWEEIILGEIGSWGKGNQLSKKDILPDGNYFCIHYGELFTTYKECILTCFSTCNLKNNTVLSKKGDLLFPASDVTPTGLGRCSVIMKDHVVLGGDIIYLRPKEKYNPIFLSYSINCNKKSITELVTGTTVKHINSSQLKTVSIGIPLDIDEQTAIAQILTDMDNEIEQLEKKRDKYLNIKSGMMQQLLTGQVRLINTTSCSEAQEAEIKNYSTDNKKKHSKQFDEAVIISFLVDKFGSTAEPLSRFMYTKLSYFIHRKHDCIVVDYKKFAAGPYNPKSRYGGPEKIGKENGYFDLVKDAKGYDAFVPQKNIQEAVDYFLQWYGADIQNWIEQFRQYKPWSLETLATVDMAINDLEEKGVKAAVSTVKTYLSSIPKWKAKLDKPHFSDVHIQRAINESIRLFKI